MLKQILSAMLALTVVSQGIVYAQEPARSGDVMTVPDHAALLEHIEELTVGEEVAVATDEGVVAGELVDKDGDDLVIDRPLVEGGAERIAIPLREVQGLGYRQPPSHKPQTRKTVIVAVVVLGILVGALVILGRGLAGP